MASVTVGGGGGVCMYIGLNVDFTGVLSTGGGGAVPADLYSAKQIVHVLRSPMRSSLQQSRTSNQNASLC